MKNLPLTALAAGFVGLAGTAASAQVASTAVLVGDTAVGSGVNSTVASLEAFNVSPTGAYAVLSGDGTQEFIVGGLSPLLLPGVLAAEGPLDGFTIDDFVSAPDIANDGTLVFRAGTTGTESIVYRGGQAVAVRGNALQPSAGFTGGTYRIPNRPQITSNGSGASFTSSIDGFGSASALFTDDGANTPLKFVFSPSGANQSTTVSGTDIRAALGSSSYEVSSDGTRYIAEFTGPGLSTANGAVAIGTIGGAVTVPTLDGSPVRENSPIASGSAERWDEFNRFGIGDDGGYLFTGNLQNATGDNVGEYLNHNGDIVLRTGDALGGGTLDGVFDTAEVNNTGDYAAITNIDGEQSLIVNGDVFFTLDSAAFVGGQLTSFESFETGIDRLGLTDAVDDIFSVYFQGTTVNGDRGLFSVTVPEPATAAALGLGGLLLTRRRRA